LLPLSPRGVAFDPALRLVAEKRQVIGPRRRRQRLEIAAAPAPINGVNAAWPRG
jgi:hypothetical protein